MSETEQRRAAAEGVLDRILRREWHQLDLLLDQTADAQFWAEVLRYELHVSSLSTGILERDKVLRELVETFGVRSISAFHYSGVTGALRVIRKGLQFRLNVDFGLADGVTVLQLAAFAGKLETVVQLVDDFKANVNAEDRQRRRPLHYACAMGHKEIAEFLMQRGADVGARDSDGATAAFRARQRSRHDIVSCLLEFYGDGDILLLEQETDSRQSPAPIYASLCRNDVTAPTSGVNDANGAGNDNVGRGDTGVYSSESTHSTEPSVPVEIQRKSKVLLKPIRRQGLKLDYEEVDLFVEEKPSSSELGDQEFSREKRGISDENDDNLEVADPIENVSASAGQQHQDESLTIGINSRSDIKTYRHGEGESSLPVLDKDRNAYKKPSGIQVDGTNYYEELPDELIGEGNNKVEAMASVSGETVHGHRKRTCMPPYEEINLPEDNNSQVKLDEHVQTVRQTRPTGFPKAKTNLKERCVVTSSSGFNKRPHLYEEIKLPEDQPINEGNFPVKSIPHNKTEEDVSHLTSSGFRRRPHHYEEIDLPLIIDAESQTEGDRSNDELLLESKVRHLLRTELRTLLPLRCTDNITATTDSTLSSRPTSTFVRDFLQTGGTCGDDANSIDRFEDVVTVRQLRRIVREEIRAFSGCVQSIEVSKEFSDECFEHFNISDKSTNSTAVNHRFQEEEEEEEVEGEKEEEQEEEEEKVHFELTKVSKPPIDDVDISHSNDAPDVGKNNSNCDNKGNASCQPKSQDRSLARILRSPGQLRRTFFSIKKDSSKQTNGRQAEPIETPSTKSNAINSESTTRTERGLKQPESGCSSTGQSHFYVRLDDNDALLSADA